MLGFSTLLLCRDLSYNLFNQPILYIIYSEEVITNKTRDYILNISLQITRIALFLTLIAFERGLRKDAWRLFGGCFDVWELSPDDTL